MSFLDVGSGSGLFSLAAARLGAERVHSFDYDPASVGCTLELRRRYGPPATDWVVARGSALDGDYLDSLGRFDVVYAWGVLHHTGDMWAAIANVGGAVAPGGRLFISIYNDQGSRSVMWRAVKRALQRASGSRPAAVRPRGHGPARAADSREVRGPRAPAGLRARVDALQGDARHEPLA